MNPRPRVLLAAATLCGGLSQVALAQTAPPVSPVPVSANERVTAHALSVKNVSAVVMAYWLDPKRNPLPKQATPLTGDGPVPASPNFPLPKGIDRIVAADQQLLVFSTDAGFQELKEIVTFLDRPLRRVEIESTWVQMSRDSAKEFGVEYGNPLNNTQPPQIGFVRGNFQALLSEMVMQNKVKIISAPRVIALNNLEANTISTDILPGKPLKPENGFFLVVNRRLSVTPTINADETISAVMSAAVTTGVPNKPENLTAKDNKNEFKATARMHDGDTIALAGIASPQSPDLKFKNDETSILVVFVTARIVRRAENNVQRLILKH